jgi:hypothetical protein
MYEFAVRLALTIVTKENTTMASLPLRGLTEWAAGGGR